MIKIKNKSECSGCHACANICPKQCITMVENEEGFMHPVVDTDICIECELCNKVCHMQNSLKRVNTPFAYACYNLNDKVRNSSSSGGMFTLFAERILELGGVVFGAAFDKNLEVKHITVDNKEDLQKLRSSKYMQSIIGDTYKQAKEILESGRVVLFSGTPCQISGLKLYLGKKYDNLYTQDIICHGVVSSKVWKKYLNYLEKKHGSSVDNSTYPSFRNKTYGWSNYSVKIHFQNDIIHNEKHEKDLFMRVYLSNKLLRSSCYKCRCKSLSRESDITLADFWGVNKVMPEIYDDKGISLILVNTDAGKALFEDIKDKCVFKETDLRKAIKYNPLAYTTPPYPFKRQMLMKNLNSWDFEKIQLESLNRSYFEKIYCRLIRIIKNSIYK